MIILRKYLRHFSEKLPNRNVVQLAECLVWDQMVGGSSPLIPTNTVLTQMHYEKD